ncbi:MAG: DNA polymerase IV [Eubacterium sp.]
MTKIRKILHCDLNSFYASVELLSHPELKDYPVAVCGNPENRHGIILAKNEPAKKYDIKTAETVYKAKQKCSDLILLPPHHDKYKHYSKIINNIYNEFTDLVEPFSIDESWLDVTGSMHLFGGSGTAVGNLVRETVKKRTGLTISVGVSYNKIFAKLGSDYKKPDAVTVITPENYKTLLWPLPVRDLIYVGKSTFEKLKGYGIRTIGDLAVFDKTVLIHDLGKVGEMLYIYANGLDDSPVRSADDPREIKSVGNGNTFSHDLTDLDSIKQGLYPLAETVSSRLKGYELKCRGIQIVIKDHHFRSISRQVMLEQPTCLEKEIFNTALDLIQKYWNFPDPIRMLTITAINLVKNNCIMPEQISLFDDKNKDLNRKKQEKVEAAMDQLRNKYGTDIIYSGTILGKRKNLK